MAIPVDFEQRNFVYTKPKDMTDEECLDLPVWKGEIPIGEDNPRSFPAIISRWKFNKEDLERINETGEIWLSITGTIMPPVSIFCFNPFTETEE